MSQRLDGATKDFERWLFNTLKIGNRHIHLKLSFTKKLRQPPFGCENFFKLNREFCEYALFGIETFLDIWKYAIASLTHS